MRYLAPVERTVSFRGDRQDSADTIRFSAVTVPIADDLLLEEAS